MRFTSSLVIGCALLLLVAGVFAETKTTSNASAQLKDLPGYVEFDSAELLGGATPNVEVFLDEELLKMMRAAAGEIDAKLGELLPDLKLIRVQVFENLTKEAADAPQKLEKLAQQLTGSRGWHPVVRVSEGSETVNILLKTAEGKITGLVVLVAEQSELVFINIVGEIEPEQLGRVLGGLGGKFFQGKLDVSQFEKMLSNVPKTPEPGLTVTGTVKDAKTRKPIEGAKVSDDGYGPEPYKGTVTDAAGKFSYQTWPEEHSIIAQAPGYKPQRVILMPDFLQKRKEWLINFELIPE